MNNVTTLVVQAASSTWNMSLLDWRPEERPGPQHQPLKPEALNPKPKSQTTDEETQ